MRRKKIGSGYTEPLKLITELGLMAPNILTPVALAERFDSKVYSFISPEHVGLRTIGGSKAWMGFSSTGQDFEGGFKVAIVGKGITFDSGGISIKPAGGMKNMKFDMLGAATVLALKETLKDFSGSVKIFGCCAENTFHHDSVRPGDVITYPNGTRVEIDNTDAEGRVVLADGILEAKKGNPDIIITIATLTGAAASALGSGTALFSNDDLLAQDALDSAEEEGELLWRLPIWDIHRKAIKVKHKVADIANCAPGAGASNAAAFLEHFIGKTPFLHFDIAGSAYKDGKPTGAMLRTITNLIRKFS